LGRGPKGGRVGGKAIKGSQIVLSTCTGTLPQKKGDVGGQKVRESCRGYGEERQGGNWEILKKHCGESIKSLCSEVGRIGKQRHGGLRKRGNG